MFRIKLDAAKVALIRAARSTQTLGRFAFGFDNDVRYLPNTAVKRSCTNSQAARLP